MIIFQTSCSRWQNCCPSHGNVTSVMPTCSWPFDLDTMVTQRGVTCVYIISSSKVVFVGLC